MNNKLKTLAELDKKAEELEKKLTEIRLEIINLFWDLIRTKEE